jgi:DNA-binding NarL/FixJ family response regulator
MIDVIVVEDNDIVRESLAALLEDADDIRCVGAFADCETMLDALKELAADVFLMDIKLPGIDGIEGTRRAKKALPEATILMLTVYDENDLIFDALCAGACGYLAKKTKPEKLIEAVREAYDGGAPMSSHIARKVTGFFQRNKKIASDVSPLTQREEGILRELIKGKTYYAIGLTFDISTDTVRFHIKKIYKKLHAHSQAEAVAEAIKKGFI